MDKGLIPRDLKEGEDYSDPSVFTDPAVRIVFTDPKSNVAVLKKGFRDRGDGFVRSWKLLEGGMMLEAECKPFVLWEHYRRCGYDMSLMEGEEECSIPIPDLVFFLALRPIRETALFPFTPERLSEYVRGFTQRSMKYLKYDHSAADFVRKNQEGVISYLSNLLVKGNLRYYRGYGNPYRYGPMAFADVTDPEKPKLLHLIYGLRPLLWEPPTGPHGHIPWKPCPNSSDEAYETQPSSP